MNFRDATEVEQICYQLKLGDYPRSANRARINELFNGWPPYSANEVDENGIAVNVNYLEGTRIAHDARAQFSSAFLKPGHFFKGTTDMGPVHKRTDRSAIVTAEINKIMKRSLDYYECFRSKFALNVLHGIGPAAWPNRDFWCPEPKGVEDVLMPSGTLLTMRNLPFLVLYKRFTGPELIRLAKGPKPDKGWNQTLVNACIEWIDQESTTLLNSNWPEVWSPEKLVSRVQSDGGFYAGDAVPTINCFDFYFYDTDDKTTGWKRRMIFDAWSNPEMTGGTVKMDRMNTKLADSAKGQFLFDSKDRKYAEKREELISFQFADLSATAPFTYHGVRSLGFLLYAVCHLQNRMRCRFNECVFENMLMLFRVKSMDDVQRVIRVMMANKGFIDENVEFIPAGDRFQINAALAELGLRENQAIINENAGGYIQNQNFSRDSTQKTKFQVMAEVNAMTSLTAAAFTQAYQYQVFEFREIFRRFCNKRSSDPDVIRFQANVLRRGVPQNMLTPEAWDLEPERLMGAGNKTLEMAIAEQLMEYRPLFDPEPQRAILRDVVLAITDDPGRAKMLVPEDPVRVTSSVHDAQLAAGTLMLGLPVAIKTGMNHIEYVDTLLASMAMVIKKITQRGNMAKPEELEGLQNMGAHVAAHIAIIAQDEKERARVKGYGDTLNKLNNLVKGFAQRLAEKMQQDQQNGEQMDPETQAKIQATMLTAQAKAQSATKSNAQRTAQRQLQWEADEQRKAQEHQRDMQFDAEEKRMQLEFDKEQQEQQLEFDRQQNEAELERERIETEHAVEMAKLEAQKPKPKPSAKK